MVTKGQVIAVFGLLNGMLGGTILVLPLLGRNTGYMMIPIICIPLGCLSGYCTYLISTHMGRAQTLRQSIREHFHNNKSFLVIYNVIVSCGNYGLLLSYFLLTIKQIEGFVSPSPLIAIISIISLFFLTLIMRKLDIGDKLLAYGLISIIGYVIFLTWAQFTAPSGDNTIEPVEPEYIDLAAALIMAFAVQNFVDTVLTKNTTPDKYSNVIIAMTFFGILTYLYIAYGCYAILNREPRVDNPQTVEDYFSFGGWQVQVIQILYFIHLISAIPQFSIVMKIKIFQLFDKEEKEEIEFIEIVYFLIHFGVMYILEATGINIATVIEINGSVIGFMYVILMPILLHWKCIYYTKKNEETGELILQIQNQKGQYEEHQNTCKCTYTYYSQFTKILELVLLMIGIGLGIYITYYTMYTVFKSPQSSDL